MEPAILRKLQLNTDQLYQQLSVATGVIGEARVFVADFLINQGIDSLDEVREMVLINYRIHVRSLCMKTSKKIYYANLLEQVTFAYLISKHPDLSASAERLIRNTAERNKAVGFLLLCGKQNPADIDYELREAYIDYVELTITSRKSEYVKALDKLKLEAIRQQNENNPFSVDCFKYDNIKVFLMYYPVYHVAMSFYYSQSKEELVFDFSIATSMVLKMQVFKMLKHVLENNENRHDRRERFLVPLKMFYLYCVEHGINDVEQITEKQIAGFRESIDGCVGSKTNTYMQLIDNFRKYLFVSAPMPNWKANAWYLEAFSFDEGRTNPARDIKRFVFGAVENKQNRDLFKVYMKYQFGVSVKSSLQTIRCQYYDILSFLKYLDDIGINVPSVSAKEMESYIHRLEEKGIQAETFNRNLISIARFYGYLVTIKEASRFPFYFDYYFKKTFLRHHNRAVPLKNQIEILKKLKYLPIHLRLMYLNLWCIGLRINEVCVIKGDAYYWDGQDAWFRIYQNKMWVEKYVPIPKLLYDVMTKYISENGIKANEYIFKNKKGGAYDAGTLCKQLKERLKGAGIEDYDFKSHDFRHTLATLLAYHNVPIETIRDYLGHKDSNMTKQYLDFVQEWIDEANKEYFAEEENKLMKVDTKENKNE